MKKLFYSLAIIAAITACNKDIVESPSTGNGEGKKFTAAFESTKVYMGEDYYYRWQEGDLVSVFTGAEHDQYKATTGDVTETELEFVSKTADLDAAVSESYAVYPYDKAATVVDGIVYTNLAAEQTYSENGLGNAIMVSKTTGSDFVFKNACALVKVNLTIAEDFTNLHAVKSIRVSSKSKPLSGAATIDVAGGDYTAKVSTQTLAIENAVTLVGCQEAGMLQADKTLTFYLAIPAGTYEAGDLTVSVLTDTESAPFNQAFNLTKSYTVNRSQYIEVTATIAKDYKWFTGTEEEVIIKENVTLVDKAIMTYDANFILQGFYDQGLIETIFDVPDHDMTITGWDLVNEGYAQTAENGPVITFKKAEADYIMNSFTTTNSGVKNLTPNKITVKALTITGELRTTTMGIWVNTQTAPTLPAGYTSHDQSAFYTIFDNVNVVDCVIPMYTDKYGGALCAFGTANINNCIIKGTTPCSTVAESDYQNIYDLCITNNTTTTISGSKVGKILTWEHLALTINNKSVVDYINCGTNSVSAKTKIVIDDAEVKEFDCTRTTTGNLPKYGTKITVTSTGKIGTLKLSSLIAGTSYSYHFTVEEGAVIERVVFDGVEMTWEAFKAAYPQYIK